MHIVINQSNDVFGTSAENKIFAQSTETITFDVTFSDPQATLQGLYCALLSDGGKTLALTTIDGNKAVLDTNTTECVEYVAQWAIGTTRHAFLVVGESTKPLAIIDVEVAQNPLEGIMPPTESAPSYPTSAELQAILAEVKAQAQSASKSAQSANQDAIFVNNAKTEVVRIGAQITTDRVLISGYASTASSSASRAEEAKRIAVNASEDVSDMQIEIGATKARIDATAKVVQSNADAVASAKTEINTAIATANTAINEAVGKADTAKTDAVKAQGEASKSAEQASTSASNASKSAQQAEDAKTAIGDVGGRLDAVEAGLASKSDRFIATVFDTFNYQKINVVSKKLEHLGACHEGLLFYDHYSSNVIFVSPNGGIISSDKALNFVLNVKYLLFLLDSVKNITRMWVKDKSGGVKLITVAGKDSDIALTVEDATLPSENASEYKNVKGFATSDSNYFVCSGGIILDATFKETDNKFNCRETFNSYYGVDFPDAIATNGQYFTYIDSVTKKPSKLTLDADGAMTIEQNVYTLSDAPYGFPLIEFPHAAMVSGGIVLRNANNGAWYTSKTAPQATFKGCTKRGYAVFGKELYNVSNARTSNAGIDYFQLSFGLLKNPLWIDEDERGNLFVSETIVSPYNIVAQPVHIFKRK